METEREFNKIELERRCERTEYRDRIRVSCRDGLEFIRNQDASSIFFFIDPPYFVKGKTLYLDSLNEEYHAALANQLKSMPDAAWILTYDDCSEIRKLYQDWATIRPFSLRYSAAERRRGMELLIAPKWMRLPPRQASLAISW
jgi:DNA adenine methylase